MNLRIIFIQFILTFCSLIGLSASKINPDTLGLKIEILKQEIELSEKQLKDQSAIIDLLVAKIEYQGNQIEGQTNLLDTSFDGISAQLSASSYFIGILGIIIAILSIGIGIYVSRIARNIKNISQDNETLLLRNLTVKQEIEELSKKITNDSKGLYKLMQVEEANHILERLISVPEDIENVFSSLASRELEELHFFQMREAYLQVKDINEFALSYLIQFFQHFAGLAVSDVQIKDAILANIDECIRVSFKNDIIKSTQDFFTSLIEKGLSDSAMEINTFVKAIGKSKYSQIEELYFAVFNTLSIRENQFLLYQLIEKIEETKKFRQNFGKLLLDYKKEDPTEKENLVFTELDNLNQ